MNTYLAAGLVIFIAQVVSTVTGFGTNVVALPLLALIVGIEPAKVTMIILSTLLYIALAGRWWRRVALRQVVVVCALGGAGMICGLLLYDRLPAHLSIILLGTFVAVIGLQGLLKPQLLNRVPYPVARVLLFVGGVVHAAFTVGGPLIVIYCRRALHDKTAFRSTLNVIWIALNGGLMLGWAIQHHWPEGTGRLTLVGLPFSMAALVAGEWVHHRIDARVFQRIVSGVLIVTGILLLMSEA